MTLAKLGKAFKKGTNGCLLDPDYINKDQLVMHLRMEQAMLTVTYGHKTRVAAHKTCFENLYMPNLSHQGYIGVTSRNSDRYVKDLEINTVKVNNLDPRFYTHEHELTEEELSALQQDRSQGQVYTDELEEGVDLIEEAAELEEQLYDFIDNNLGNLREDDSIEEILYKMNEQLNKVVNHLGDLVKNEDMMQHNVRSHELLPQIVKTFEELPKAIENERSFLETIDFQLIKI